MVTKIRVADKGFNTANLLCLIVKSHICQVDSGNAIIHAMLYARLLQHNCILSRRSFVSWVSRHYFMSEG